MDRRTALKNITLGLGYVATTSSMLSVLNSCKEQNPAWKASFLTPDEQSMVSHLVDIILPKDDLPGALDVNVPQFIDKMLDAVETKENQQLFRSGGEIFGQLLENKAGKKKSNANRTDIESIFKELFTINEVEQERIKSLTNKKVAEVAETDKENYLLYSFLMKIRYYTLFGYYTSEKVGEEILSYDPVPGVFQGCIPLSDVGNAWSL
ncbi:gluconate 2-dehydrogenase subunit 3 family protein [Namhaeicola litoreus]|uniref:Gluconate 2-dehydrogenase subunit 3 family protein n=1 Tax=Namhaeicola litoreus TaxID=1052145 RepID=A0ABW3Y5K0_9FLAO